ncbi:hypothetical protein [Evansella clarkii]|uniref:hypothetical protein n=1 Tax=Evansella clarkii TaxID=79879 RepID=UPI001472D5A6|nr:hypothetical protein [Evansella clarkii]
MLKKFKGFKYEEVKKKWEKGDALTAEEIAGLFAMVDAKNDRLEAIKALVED